MTPRVPHGGFYVAAEETLEYSYGTYLTAQSNKEIITGHTTILPYPGTYRGQAVILNTSRF